VVDGCDRALYLPFYRRRGESDKLGA
jgi:hypothetical protein